MTDTTSTTVAASPSAEENFHLALRAISDGLWEWDLLNERIRLCERSKVMLGCGSAGQDDDPENWLGRVHSDDQARLRRYLNGVRRANGADEVFYEHRILRQDGSWRRLLLRGMVMRDEEGRALRMAGALTDVTRDRLFDSLTGLPNRVLFVDNLERAITAFQADSTQSFAVLFVDLDRFKLVNESLGHLAGDKLLNEIAVRLERAAAALDGSHGSELLTARLEGDTFGVLAPGVKDPDQARALAARIRDSLCSPVHVDGRPIFTNVTIGITIAARHHERASEMLRDTETAMYKAKAAGAGAAVVFDAELRAHVVRRLAMETDLQFALEREQLEVWYQPKVNLTMNRLAGFEALVRWRHPVHDSISPAEFIPIAEETGLIVPIGKWVLQKACAQMAAWSRVHPHDPPLTLAVNLSVRQFQNPNLIDQVREVLQTTGLPPERLRLEITESLVIGDTGAAVRTLKALHGLGVSLEIDDFGTGYSSLSYLANLPFHAIKIDRSFVTNILQDESALAVVKAIIFLARSLGKDVIAEGVESREQMERLRELGCGYGQGYLFSRPLSESAAQQMASGGFVMPRPAAR